MSGKHMKEAQTLQVLVAILYILLENYDHITSA